jgi:hypothetical protein
MTKAEQLAEDFGYESTMECMEDTFNDGTIPGICTNPDCDYSTDVEPDQEHGWCEVCGTGTVASIQILEGMI